MANLKKIKEILYRHGAVEIHDEENCLVMGEFWYILTHHGNEYQLINNTCQCTEENVYEDLFDQFRDKVWKIMTDIERHNPPWD